MAKKVTKSQAKKAAKAAKKHPVAAIIIVALLLTVVIAAVILYFAKPDLYHKYLGVGEHTYSEWVRTEPTCQADGSLSRYCTVCGEEEVEVIPKNYDGVKHVYTEWTTTEATCGEDGYRVRRCTECGEEDSEVLPATGDHNYGEWDITQPVCGTDGEKVRSCTVCGHEDSEIIPALGEHVYTKWDITEPTCGEAGKKVSLCDVCGEKETVVLPATGEHSMGPDNVCTVCGYNANVTAVSDVEIHFLELGNKNAGDCTLIKCGDTEVLIDAGSKRNSTKTVIDYVNQYCTDGTLEYVIATHAHEDHIAALVGEDGKNNGVMYSFKIGTIITYAGHKTTSKVYNDFETSVTYAVNQGATRYTAKECWYGQNGAKKQYFLDDKESVSLNVLYQKYYDQTTSNENNYSVCTLLSQKVSANETYNYLFTGDLESGGEKSLVESNDLPKCKLFKGGHHGSSTSSTDALLSKIQPENIAICTCAGTYEYADKPNTKPSYLPEATAKLNTFPTQEAIDRMSKWTSNIYVTTMGILGSDYSTVDFKPMNGNIVFYTEKGELKLRCSNNTTILKETAWFKENRTWNGV